MTEIHSNTWHLGEEDNWNVDQEVGTLELDFADGTVATAPVQLIGTYNDEDGSFLWGWDHPSIEPELQKTAHLVKAFAEKHNFEELLDRKVTCSEERAWEYTALAMRISEANCAYRAEASPGTIVFMNFGEVALSKDM